MRSADRADDDFGEKILGALGGKGAIEMLDKQEINSEPRQFALLDPERGQPKRLARRNEHGSRMRLEGQHGGGPVLLPRHVACARDKQRVAAMQAVEIAHRQDRAARVVRSGAGMSDDADHGCRARLRFIIRQVP